MPLVGLAVNFFVRLALWSLGLLDRVVAEGVGYLTPKYYQEDDESLLCVQNQNGCSDGPGEAEGEKKINFKLLLDINIGPGGPQDSEVVSAVVVTKASPIFLLRWALIGLQTWQVLSVHTREPLERLLEKNPVRNMRTPANPTQIPVPERKKKSPRKRLSGTNLLQDSHPTLPLKLIRVFGVGTFEMPDVQALLALKNRKGEDSQRHVEKRKMSDISTASETLTNESCPSSEEEPEISSANANNPQAEGVHVAKRNGRSKHSANLVRFMEFDDENYKSEEDPTYVPDEAELNASSSTNESFDDHAEDFPVGNQENDEACAIKEGVLTNGNGAVNGNSGTNEVFAIPDSTPTSPDYYSFGTDGSSEPAAGENGHETSSEPPLQLQRTGKGK